MLSGSPKESIPTSPTPSSRIVRLAADSRWWTAPAGPAARRSTAGERIDRSRRPPSDPLRSGFRTSWRTATALLDRFTLSRSRSLRNASSDVIARLPATFDFAQTLRSSAYRRNRCPLHSSSSSRSSSRTFERGDDGGPPRGGPSVRSDTGPPLHEARLRVAPDQQEDPLVLHPPRRARHQDVVVDPVEELLEVRVHEPSVSGGHVPPRTSRRTVRPASRPQAEAPVRERGIEDGLEDRERPTKETSSRPGSRSRLVVGGDDGQRRSETDTAIPCAGDEVASQSGCDRLRLEPAGSAEAIPDRRTTRDRQQRRRESAPRYCRGAIRLPVCRHRRRRPPRCDALLDRRDLPSPGDRSLPLHARRARQAADPAERRFRRPHAEGLEAGVSRARRRGDDGSRSGAFHTSAPSRSSGPSLLPCSGPSTRFVGRLRRTCEKGRTRMRPALRSGRWPGGGAPRPVKDYGVTGWM